MIVPVLLFIRDNYKSKFIPKGYTVFRSFMIKLSNWMRRSVFFTSFRMHTFKFLILCPGELKCLDTGLSMLFILMSRRCSVILSANLLHVCPM